MPEARQLLVKPFDPSIIKHVERALLTSDLGLPPLSEEQRKKLVVKVKDMADPDIAWPKVERWDCPLLRP